MSPTELVAQALPCPFCGERLVVHTWYIRHAIISDKRRVTCCIAYTIVVCNETDLALWNTRVETEK